MFVELILHAGRGLVAFLFGSVVLYHAVNLYGLPTRLMSPRIAPWSTAATCLVLAFAVYALVMPLQWENAAPWPVWALAALALALTVPFTFLQKTFGNSHLGNIISAMQENKAGDLAEVAAADLRPDLIEMGALTLLACLVSTILLLSLPGFPVVLTALSAAAILSSRPARYLFRALFPDKAGALITLAKDFHPPVITERPERPPNLVLIYLESLERSYREHPVTADPFAKMAEFEDRHFSARHVGQVDGLHYSAAGLISTLGGIPLFPRGLVDAKTVTDGTKRSRVALAAFMPNLTTLGDLLRNEGYVGTYLNGSDVEIFSIGDFMRSHGFSKVVGMKPKRDEIKVPGQNSWGVPDLTLFAEAKAEMARLSSTGQPFFLSLLTASTHGPNGYPEPGFSYVPPKLPAVKNSLLPAAIHCSIEQTLDFIAEIDRLGLSDNTVVVVMSDHLAMPNTLWKELRAVGDRRSNLLVIKGGTVAKKGAICDRPATHLDTFPTILEAMGYKLRDGRGNLGVSLLSGRPTLAQTLGFPMLERALKAKCDIRRHVWMDPDHR